MTIPESTLHKPQNSFIAVSSDAVVGQAMAALLAANGQHWWRLLVRSRDNRWLGTTFGKLYHALRGMPDPEHMKVSDCPTLELVPILEWESAEIEKAEHTASHNPSTMVAIIKGQDLAGIIVAPRRDAVMPLSVGQLTELAGEYIDLKQYGAVLLATSQRKSSDPKEKAT